MIDRRSFLKTILVGSALVVPGSPLLAASGLGSKSFEKDYITKIKNMNSNFKDDVVLTGNAYRILIYSLRRIKKLQSLVGYANFSMLNFDEALKYARNYSSVGAFTKAEINFIESIFYRKAEDYGFFGEKVMRNLTDVIPTRAVSKVRGSGHFIFRENSLALYNKIRRDVGSNIILTSGVRGVMKQLYLFLNKTYGAKGNLSKASRSLAPPGHSFHGVGDFDVGKRGYGYLNFTEKFARTSEFKKLQDLGYVKIRYPENNPFGVRYEPWHIKVIKT